LNISIDKKTALKPIIEELDKFVVVNECLVLEKFEKEFEEE